MFRVDIHHHFFPPSLDKASSGKNVGFRTPAENLPWDPEISIRSMDSSNIDVALLSFPAIASGSVGKENRRTTRDRNLYVSEICQRYPGRFGFFATLPFLDDIEGVLEEITYALEILGAQGISMSSSYGEGSSAKYIGDDTYDPIWAELNRRKTVLFLHGAQTPSSTPYPHASLGIPIVEVPNETFKAASHLVVTGRKRRYPDVKIILAHLGGSAPYLAARVAVLSSYMGCSLTPDEIIGDFKTFYYDTALSAHEVTLSAMESFVSHDRVLFGSDFPAVNTEMSSWYTNNLETFYKDKRDILEKINYKNALNLFPGLQEKLPPRGY
ncbi:amidohydrolase 2 [Marasmius fiardii PR-910]|nr:amidohydrolase 2 [Marasmius fiardii PR-910]